MKNIRNVKRQDLIRIGLDPKLFPPERLFYWLIKPRNPVLASDDPLARMFIEGMLKNEPVGLIKTWQPEEGECVPRLPT